MAAATLGEAVSKEQTLFTQKDEFFDDLDRLLSLDQNASLETNTIYGHPILDRLATIVRRFCVSKGKRLICL